ncbi:hypothetical protein DFH07DRAFT_965039 [Mycena maculata]|uniref:Uncharacterized protein n=1 Tax=Mycena maculata TaxID=230809 RepID=A0AAD7N125_9AGAR|nr:hypothetical protein DFH07DRAFT_965039 [Mycena maculata]
MSYGSPIETYMPDWAPTDPTDSDFFDVTTAHKRAMHTMAGTRPTRDIPRSNFQSPDWLSDTNTSASSSHNDYLRMHSNGALQPDLVASASHSDLVSRGNMTYITLYRSNQILQEQFNSLQASFVSLTQSLTKTATTISPAPMPSASPFALPAGDTSLALPDLKEYPQVRFWSRKKYTVTKDTKTTTLNSTSAKRGSSRIVDDVNVMHRYLEKEDGSIVSGREAQEMRRTQASIFVEIKTKSRADLPQRWGEASLTVRNYHRSQMYSHHPILRLCNAHWKVDKMATDAYSSWYKKNVRKKENLKGSSLGSDGCTCICTCSALSDADEDDDMNPAADASSSSPPPTSNTSHKRKDAPSDSDLPQRSKKSKTLPSTSASATAPLASASASPLTPFPVDDTTPAPQSPTSPLVPLPESVSVSPGSTLQDSPVITNPSASPSANISTSETGPQEPLILTNPLDSAFGLENSEYGAECCEKEGPKHGLQCEYTSSLDMMHPFEDGKVRYTPFLDVALALTSLCIDMKTNEFQVARSDISIERSISCASQNTHSVD